MFPHLEGREMLQGKARAPELRHLQQSRGTPGAGERAALSQCMPSMPSTGREGGRERKQLDTSSYETEKNVLLKWHPI